MALKFPFRVVIPFSDLNMPGHVHTDINAGKEKALIPML